MSTRIAINSIGVVLSIIQLIASGIVYPVMLNKTAWTKGGAECILYIDPSDVSTRYTKNCSATSHIFLISIIFAAILLIESAIFLFVKKAKHRNLIIGLIAANILLGVLSLIAASIINVGLNTTAKNFNWQTTEGFISYYDQKFLTDETLNIKAALTAAWVSFGTWTASIILEVVTLFYAETIEKEVGGGF